MRNGWGSVLTIFVLFVMSACQPRAGEQQTGEEQSGEQQETTSVDTAEIRTALDSLRSSFEAAFEAGDIERMASFYAEDAIYSPPGAPPIRGRDSILTAMRRTHPAGATVEISPGDVMILGGSTAYEFGTGTVTFTPEGAEQPVEVSSTYSLLLQRTPDGWKLWREALSSNQPGGS